MENDDPLQQLHQLEGRTSNDDQVSRLDRCLKTRPPSPTTHSLPPENFPRLNNPGGGDDPPNHRTPALSNRQCGLRDRSNETDDDHDGCHPLSNSPTPGWHQHFVQAAQGHKSPDTDWCEPGWPQRPPQNGYGEQWNQQLNDMWPQPHQTAHCDHHEQRSKTSQQSIQAQQRF